MTSFRYLAVFIFGAYALAASPQKVFDNSYGLGFSLSSGYGTASASFPNGTIVNIVKVEGGNRYKDYIRSLNDPSIVEWPAVYSPTSFWAKAFCRLWPQSCPSGSVFTPIIAALKSAAENTLEHKVDLVHLAISQYPGLNPDWNEHFPTLNTRFSSLNEHIDAGLKDSGMSRLRSSFKSNGPCAARIHGMSGDWGETDDGFLWSDPAQLILTVENTREALTMSIFEEQSGTYDIDRQVHSHALGEMALDKCIKSEDSCTDKLEAAIREVTRMPVDTFMGDMIPGLGSRIDAVVVFGEGGEDHRLNAILKKVLQEAYGDYGVQIFGRRSHIDPTFAAAADLAQRNWQFRDANQDDSYQKMVEEDNGVPL